MALWSEQHTAQSYISIREEVEVGVGELGVMSSFMNFGNKLSGLKATPDKKYFTVG